MSKKCAVHSVSASEKDPRCYLDHVTVQLGSNSTTVPAGLAVDID